MLQRTKSNTSSLLQFIGEKTSPPSSIHEITQSILRPDKTNIS